MTKKHFDDGVYDISNDEYHDSSGFSRSALIKLSKSPYHFWYEYISGLCKKKEQTPSMIIGTAFHTLLLEPHKFEEEICVAPKIDRRTAKGKEDYERFLNDSLGKTILNQEQFEKVKSMASFVNKHSIVKDLLDGCRMEKSIYWTDLDTGIQFKVRPDAWLPTIVVDIKTTSDISINRFGYSAQEYGYYLQAGMTYEALKSLGILMDAFVILAVEKEEPYAPAVFNMSQKAIQYGIDQFTYFKKILAGCLEKNEWPGYKIQELDISEYATKQMESI